MEKQNSQDQLAQHLMMMCHVLAADVFTLHDHFMDSVTFRIPKMHFMFLFKFSVDLFYICSLILFFLPHIVNFI